MLSQKTCLSTVLATAALAFATLVGLIIYDADAPKALPVVGALPWHIAVGNTAIQPKDRPVASFLSDVAKAVDEQPKLLFLGDSLSSYWKMNGKAAWNEHFANRHATTLGVSGDRTQHLLYRLRSGAFDQLRPEAIVLQIGTNNVNRNTADEISAAIEMICAEIHHKWPGARLAVVAIPPRELPRSLEVLDRVRRTNELLAAKLKSQANTVFVDDGGCFLTSDGWLNPDLFTDEGVHFSEQGYTILAQLIDSAL